MNAEMDDFLLYISSLKSRSNLLTVHLKHWLSKIANDIHSGCGVTGCTPLSNTPLYHFAYNLLQQKTQAS